MIAEQCFTKAWLDQCRSQVGRADPGLLEKSIHAFDLVGRLAAAQLPFVFKGGTAMLLLLDNFRRLSIDVDIACPLPREEVARIVTQAVAGGRFISVIPDERDPERLPKRHHYELKFASVVDPRVPATLQLDVLESDGHYPQTQLLPLRSKFILPAGDILVTAPTVEGLLADKLTAFAPKTVGVPYNAFKASIKIAKHAADIGELFLHMNDGNGLSAAYDRIFEAENSYRSNAFTRNEALDDTIEAARILCGINLKGFVATPESSVLLSGVAQVDTHMMGARYTLDSAKVAAARAAHLAARIRADDMPAALSEIRCGEAEISASCDVKLEGRFTSLSRLFRFNPEAFCHWVRVQDLLRPLGLI